MIANSIPMDFIVINIVATQFDRIDAVVSTIYSECNQYHCHQCVNGTYIYTHRKSIIYVLLILVNVEQYETQQKSLTDPFSIVLILIIIVIIIMFLMMTTVAKDICVCVHLKCAL